jgi:hypothetical protein
MAIYTNEVVAMKLYHRDVFFKPSFHICAVKGIPLTFSKHAVDRVTDKSIDSRLVPRVISDTSRTVVIETETEDNGVTIVKQLIRHPYDAQNDLVIAVKRDGFVKTMWLNKKTDTHRTLDKTKYERR